MHRSFNHPFDLQIPHLGNGDKTDAHRVTATFKQDATILFTKNAFL